jgi:uncharacterized membrane protein
VADDISQVRTGWRGTGTGTRLVVMLVVGAIAAVVTGLSLEWAYAPMAGWAVAALTFEVWSWLAINRMDAEQTRAHATREDPSRAISDLLLLLANLASLAAVVYVIIDAGRAQGAAKAWLGGAALLSVAISWVLVQTLYTLRYARLYYLPEKPGGVDFNMDDPPDYHDFAYLAFTMGMAYQVSDTALQNSAFRKVVLRHGLTSYVFGSVILATTINLVVGLSGS